MLNKKKMVFCGMAAPACSLYSGVLSPLIYMVLNSFKPYSQMLKDPWDLRRLLYFR